MCLNPFGQKVAIQVVWQVCLFSPPPPNRLQSPLISKYTLKLWQLTSFNWTWEGLCSSSHPHLFLITREGVRKIKSALQLVRKSEVGAAWVMTHPYSFIMGKLVVLFAFSLNWPVPYFTVCRKYILKGKNGVRTRSRAEGNN